MLATGRGTFLVTLHAAESPNLTSLIAISPVNATKASPSYCARDRNRRVSMVMDESAGFPPIAVCNAGARLQ
jgi:hypothetical protein